MGADPTFALALLRLSQTVSWLRGHGSPQAVRLGEAAAQFRTRLPARDQTLVLANQLFEAGRLEALDTLRSYVTRYPDDAEAWYQLGSVQYRARYLVAAGPAELYNPFDRVLEIDSTLTPALIYPIELSLSERDSTRFHRYFRALQETSLTPDVERFELARQLLWGEQREAEAFLEALGGGSGADPLQDAIDLLGIFLNKASLTGDTVPGSFLRAVDAVLGRTPLTDSRYANLLAARARLLNAGGQITEARELVLRLAALDRERAMHVSLLPVLAGYAPYVGDFPFEGGDDETLFEEARLERAYWQSLDAIARNDTAAARLAAEGALAIISRDETAPYRGLLIAVLGWVDILSGDSGGGAARMSTGLHQAGYLPWVTELSAPLRLQLARTLALQPATRLEGIRRLRYGTAPGDWELVPISILELGRARDASGDLSGAVEAYREFTRWWNNADPELQPLVAEAEAGIGVLTPER
jgi:tetratricopeptide (TPR) repeat protein